MVTLAPLPSRRFKSTSTVAIDTLRAFLCHYKRIVSTVAAMTASYSGKFLSTQEHLYLT